MAKTTSISVVGDREYVRRLRREAEDLGVPMGEVVRRALNVTCGETLEHLASFVAKSGTHTNRMECECSNGA